MISPNDWTEMILRLAVASLVGLTLGLNRERHGHDAGLRTHALVALSSATITVSALLLHAALVAGGSNGDPLRVVQGLAQAIGFIAAGLIFVKRGDVHNLTTASSLWMAAAIGIASGAGQYRLVAIAFGFAVALLGLAHWSKRIFPEKPPGDGAN